MLPLEPPIEMSEEEFRLIRDYINERCGIYFDIKSKYLLEKRLSAQLREKGLKDFKDYYYFLRYSDKDAHEFNRAVEVLTTNETYFFREEFQLRAFADEILPEILARNSTNRTLRIWSAGCSTGEEPYTIAILALESGLFRDWKVDIFATDISQRVLHIAREGIYSESSFRVTRDFFIRKYFEKVGNKYKISDRIKSMVNFGYLNLLDTEAIDLLGPIDIIFCRNVIIYFNIEAKKTVIGSFFKKISPQGYLLLGHSESLMNISTDFVLKHFQNDMVYQKPATSSLPERKLEF